MILILIKPKTIRFTQAYPFLGVRFSAADPLSSSFNVGMQSESPAEDFRQGKASKNTFGCVHTHTNTDEDQPQSTSKTMDKH